MRLVRFHFRIIRNLGVGIVLSILVVSSGWTQNVSVTDYEVPVSAADRLFIDLSANHATTGGDVTTSKGNVGGVYKRFYDSLPFGYSIDLIGSGSADKDIVQDEYKTDYNLNGDARVKKYLIPNNEALKDVFGFVRLNASMLKSYDQPASAVTVGVGYGRFIEATALAKAVRIEEFLMKEGELKEHLPKAVILEVSQIINRRQEYEDRYGEVFKKEWYDDMEAVMRASGLLNEDGLGAIGILRIDEVLEREKIADRFYGWDVTIGSKFDLTLPFDNQDRPPANLDVSASYARPISWQWQVSERLSMSTPFDGLGKAVLSSLSSDISYELSNRIDFRLRHLFQVDKPEVGDSQLSNSLGLSLIYYLENYINLVVTEQIEKAPDKKTTTNFIVALNYRIF